jgi:hypothetical protein
MNKYLFVFLFSYLILFSCTNQNTKDMPKEHKAIFLHHSTGQNIWRGDVSKISWKLFKEGNLEKQIKKYNKKHKTDFFVEDLIFPKKQPYGWKNYPFDYYNIWVKNAGTKPFMEEPTLEMLSKDYGLIIWKHCYPVSAIKEDTGTPDIDSEEHRVENYKLQYNALKEKMHQFPDTKFLVWTGAVHSKVNNTEESALRMKEFVDWVRNEWDEKGDNIYLWDFYALETEGGLYLKDEYAAAPNDSHPGKKFAEKVIPYFAKRIIDVMSGKGDETDITGR